MLTKADFQRVIEESIDTYPAVALLFHAGDPRMRQHLDAMAAMLAMLSAQVEVAQAEPFEKVRDATVLADAAMRGIVRKGSPARVRIRAANAGAGPFVIETGRMLLDSAGLLYRIETPVEVPAGGEATFEARQVRAVTIKHAVTGTEPFYAIQIPEAEDGAHLCGIGVRDAAGEYQHRTRYVGTLPGERVFHVEADDRQRVYVRFGFDNVVGVQPKRGTEITLEVSYTAGEVSPQYGSPFAFEVMVSPAEARVELKMDALLVEGQNPMPISVLRDLARYPSVYSADAVFLGEFDFLVRRNYPSLQFLSVWNEATEERARGAHMDNINALFVACLSKGGGEVVLSDDDPENPAAPRRLEEGELTDTQRAIRATILAADDSYRIRFVTPVRSKVAMDIRARVSTSYIGADVRQQISEAVLAEFGPTSVGSRRGRSRPLYQRVYALLKERVPALSSNGADLKVNIAEPEAVLLRPELWRYVAADSLTVTVDTANIVTSQWTG